MKCAKSQPYLLISTFTVSFVACWIHVFAWLHPAPRRIAMGFIPGADQERGIADGIPAVTTILPTRPTGVDILTTAVIHSFDKHNPGVPIHDFNPKYFPHVHAILVICSALFVFFFRNTFTVARYIHSGKVPQKALFYVFLASQVTGFIFPLPTLVSIFAERVNCRLIGIVSTVTNFLSLSFLVTGILGVKAYRCLDRSKVVLMGLVLLRTVSMVLLILDLINLDVERQLVGACIRRSPMNYAAGITVSQLGELIFISCSFAWGFWRTNSRPGRLTIPITPILPNAPRRMMSEDSHLRGWWDSLPDEPDTRSKNPEIAGSEGTQSQSSFGGSTWHSDQLTKHRKSSLRTAHPLSQPNREFGHRPRLTSRLSTYAVSVAASSLVSKFGFQIKTVKNLLRNELAFASVVTLLQGATSILAMINMNSGSFFPAYCLSMITWVTISQLLLLSFDRVIRRHEKEAILKNPGFWEPARREVRGVFRVPTTRESSLLGSINPAFPGNVTHRSENTTGSIVSDPFMSRRSSWSSSVGSRSSAELELLSKLDPMREGPDPGTTLFTIPSYLHPPEWLPPSPAPSSPRSTILSSMHILPGRSGGNG